MRSRHGQLQFVWVENNEKYYPRLEVGSTYGGLIWVIKLLAGQGFTPLGGLDTGRWCEQELDDAWPAMLTMIEEILRAEPYQGSSSAMAALLDVRAGRGRALGNIGVYAFTDRGVEVCYDGTSFGKLSAEYGGSIGDLGDGDWSFVGMPVNMLTPRGFEGETIPDAFELGDARALVISSEALHWRPWWPPSSPSQAIAGLAESEQGRNTVLATWTSRTA